MVLPDPCSPAISTTVGGCEANFSLAVSLPSIVDQFVAHDLDHLLGRRKRGHHFLPYRLGPNVVDQLFDDFEVDVGLKQRHADFFQRLADILFRQAACPRRFLKARCSFS